jgi:hemerythrin-like domain-containing protein
MAMPINLTSTGNSKMARRVMAIAVGTGAIALATGAQDKQSAHSDEEGVTAPEDLMKEHGVLNRCLLVYEEVIRRVQSNKEIPSQALYQTADLVKRFVEEYHEKNEENYIFPVFLKAGEMSDLVQTLLAQHKKGRLVTDQILQLSQPAAFKDPANQAKTVDLCEKFIRMYRPHEAREDTVLFPGLRTILSPDEVEALGGHMEENETKVLGKQGFEKSVATVEAIEKQLGIYELARFTPAL